MPFPGMELRRIRNSRGLKPSQLARLGGHHSLALLLSSSRSQRPPAGEGPAGGPLRGASRGEHGAFEARGERGRERRGGRERRRPHVTQEAVLLELVQVLRCQGIGGRVRSALRPQAEGGPTVAPVLVWRSRIGRSCCLRSCRCPGLVGQGTHASCLYAGGAYHV